mgnify:CR=1 FL=1
MIENNKVEDNGEQLDEYRDEPAAANGDAE